MSTDGNDRDDRDDRDDREGVGTRAAIAAEVPADAIDLDELTALWIAVTDAGGSIGLSPPVTDAQARPLAVGLLDEVRDGQVTLLAAHQDERLVGLVSVYRPPSFRTGHRAYLRRLQVHPDQQGTGLGGRLVEAAHAHASQHGAELAIVEVRDGEGLDGFYHRYGYVEVGRIPDALAFEDGSRRDEVLMVADLRGGDGRSVAWGDRAGGTAALVGGAGGVGGELTGDGRVGGEVAADGDADG